MQSDCRALWCVVCTHDVRAHRLKSIYKIYFSVGRISKMKCNKRAGVKMTGNWRIHSWFYKGITTKRACECDSMCLCDQWVAQYQNQNELYYEFLCWIYAFSVLTALKLGFRHCVLWIWMLIPINMLSRQVQQQSWHLNSSYLAFRGLHISILSNLLCGSVIIYNFLSEKYPLFIFPNAPAEICLIWSIIEFTADG